MQKLLHSIGTVQLLIVCILYCDCIILQPKTIIKFIVSVTNFTFFFFVVLNLPLNDFNLDSNFNLDSKMIDLRYRRSTSHCLDYKAISLYKSTANMGEHVPIKGTWRRCGRCNTPNKQKRSNIICIKCNIALCKECFEPFHRTAFL